MIKIENRLAQPVVINQGKGRVLHLLAGAHAVIEDAALETSEIRELISRGVLAANPLGTKAPGSKADAAPKPPAAVVPLVVTAAEPVPTPAAEMLPDPAVAPLDAPGAPPAASSSPQAKATQPKPKKEN